MNSNKLAHGSVHFTILGMLLPIAMTVRLQYGSHPCASASWLCGAPGSPLVSGCAAARSYSGKLLLRNRRCNIIFFTIMSTKSEQFTFTTITWALITIAWTGRNSGRDTCLRCSASRSERSWLSVHDLQSAYRCTLLVLCSVNKRWEPKSRRSLQLSVWSYNYCLLKKADGRWRTPRAYTKLRSNVFSMIGRC